MLIKFFSISDYNTSLLDSTFINPAPPTKRGQPLRLTSFSYSFYAFAALSRGFSFGHASLQLVDNLYHKSCKSICSIREQNSQNKHNAYVKDCSKNSDCINYSNANFFKESNVASVKIVEVSLESIGHNRCDCYVNPEEDGHHLQVALGVEFVQSESNGKHKIQNHKIVEGDCMEIAEGVEIIDYIAVRIDNSGH